MEIEEAVEWKKLSDKAEAILDPDHLDECVAIVWNLVTGSWFVTDAPGRAIPFKNAQVAPKALIFSIPTMNLQCGPCGRVQAFNLTSAAELFGERLAPTIEKPSTRVVQTFTFSFQCQSCKSEPEAFLIRREGLKIILGGRVPMERVDVPKALPKGPASKYYRDALIAYEAGFTLAGIFYLRVLIEQYSIEDAKRAKKKVVGEKGASPRSVDFIDAYMDDLDKDFKNRFPSFRDAYGELSEAIHQAKESPETFTKVRREIELHFDGIDLFKRAGKAR